MAEVGEPRGEQREVMRLFGRHAQPIAVKRFRHVRKPPDGVEREIDRVEFDMGQCMKQRGPAFLRLHAAMPQKPRRDQGRAFRAPGQTVRLRDVLLRQASELARRPARKHRPYAIGFRNRIAQRERPK